MSTRCNAGKHHGYAAVSTYENRQHLRFGIASSCFEYRPYHLNAQERQRTVHVSLPLSAHYSTRTHTTPTCTERKVRTSRQASYPREACTGDRAQTHTERGQEAYRRLDHRRSAKARIITHLLEDARVHHFSHLHVQVVHLLWVWFCVRPRLVGEEAFHSPHLLYESCKFVVPDRSHGDTR